MPRNYLRVMLSRTRYSGRRGYVNHAPGESSRICSNEKEHCQQTNPGASTSIAILTCWNFTQCN